MRWCLLLMLGCLVGCATQSNYAPVANGWSDAQHVRGGYRVQKGDTLYSIAFNFGKDYHELAALNHLRFPYTLHPDQPIVIAGKAHTSHHRSPVVIAKTKHKAHQSKSYTRLKTKPVQVTRINETPKNSAWIWPARGKVAKMNKGIDIFGKKGDPVRATASGTVVYSSHGLRGYGELVIIKHGSDYLSAYAHNNKLLVQENQQVKKGDVIATMGNSESDSVLLHFEIRRHGKPVDPLNYLPNTSLVTR